MEKYLTAAIFATLLFANTIETQASGSSGKSYHFRSVVPRKGYWVIQQSPVNGKQVTVFYYNDSHELLKKEYRERKNADITRNKVLRSLKRRLEEAIDWSEPIY